jgi:hypothetical protein
MLNKRSKKNIGRILRLWAVVQTMPSLSFLDFVDSCQNCVVLLLYTACIAHVNNMFFEFLRGNVPVPRVDELDLVNDVFRQ